MVTLTPSQREALKGILARKGYDADTMRVARRDLAVHAHVDRDRFPSQCAPRGPCLVGYADELLWHDEAEAERRKTIHG
jgi:hypothetical protein